MNPGGSLFGNETGSLVYPVAASVERRCVFEGRVVSGTRLAASCALSRFPGTFTPARSLSIGASFVTPADVNQDGALDLATVDWAGTNATILIGDGLGSFTQAVDLGLEARGSTTKVNGVAVADLDGDGERDIALSAPEKRGLLLLTRSETADSNIEATARNFDVEAEPHAATVGDLDGDGDLDVVTGDGGFSQVTLLMNDGRGALTRLRSYPVAGCLASIAVADFDRDGDLDIIVADSRGTTVWVMLNEGAAAYGGAARLPVGANPYFVTAGDFSGDDVPDIVTANSGSGTVSLLAGSGDGTFLPAEALDVGGAPAGAALTDLDGDRATDLAVVTDGTSELIVFRGIGDGTFDGGMSYGVQNPSYVAAGDLDGDGDPDLAVASEVLFAAFIFTNSGDGTFAPPRTVDIGHGPYSIAAVDMSGDGALDLVTANQFSNTVSILINEGRGAFAVPFEYSVGTDPRFILTGDLDGDGDADLASANHTSSDVTVLLNVTARTHLESICLQVDFFQVAAPASRPGPVVASTKYFVPVNPGAPGLLAPVFQNVRVFPLHQEFLVRVFPERFPALTVEAYDRLVNRRATRSYFAGAIHLVETDEGPFYGFNVLANYFADPDEVPAVEEVRGVYETLSSVFNAPSPRLLPRRAARSRRRGDLEGSSVSRSSRRSRAEEHDLLPRGGSPCRRAMRASRSSSSARSSWGPAEWSPPLMDPAR